MAATRLSSTAAHGLLPFLAALLFSAAGSTQGIHRVTGTPGVNVELNSPDSNIHVLFRSTDSLPVYSVQYKGIPIVEASPLDLVFKESSGAVSFSHRECTSALSPGKEQTTIPCR